MRPVLAYNAEIHVAPPPGGDGRVRTLLIDRPDWAPEGEVLREVARERGVGTVGELVGLLEREGRVRVEVAEGSFYCRGDRGVWGWGERVG